MMSFVSTSMSMSGAMRKSYGSLYIRYAAEITRRARAGCDDETLSYQAG